MKQKEFNKLFYIYSKNQLEEKSLKLLLIQGYCEKHLFRCPASASQASMKQMAMSILKIIDGEN